MTNVHANGWVVLNSGGAKAPVCGSHIIFSSNFSEHQSTASADVQTDIAQTCIYFSYMLMYLVRQRGGRRSALLLVHDTSSLQSIR